MEESRVDDIRAVDSKEGRERSRVWEARVVHCRQIYLVVDQVDPVLAAQAHEPERDGGRVSVAEPCRHVNISIHF